MTKRDCECFKKQVEKAATRAVCYAKPAKVVRKPTLVWAVVDQRYGVVGLYWTKNEASRACDAGVGLDSGYAGSIQPMRIHTFKG